MSDRADAGQDDTAAPVSRDKILRRERGQTDLTTRPRTRHGCCDADWPDDTFAASFIKHLNHCGTERTVREHLGYTWPFHAETSTNISYPTQGCATYYNSILFHQWAKSQPAKHEQRVENCHLIYHGVSCGTDDDRF